ncbi:MAG: WHG domain-containing protein, partial [Acidimicrobiia bacterium]|nr:WHG domain-containing protein [Acidimicrobiia bacterium]
MARRVGIDVEDVRRAAAELADRHGLDALTLSAVARRLGIRPPSLYAHVEGVDGLRRLVASDGARRLADVLTDVAEDRSGREALAAFMHAYRAFAHRHPGLYEASQRDAPAPAEDPELAEALVAPVLVVAGALSDVGVPADRHVPVIRGLRSALHGWVDLERLGGFGLPEDVDDSFDTLVAMLLAGIA